MSGVGGGLELVVVVLGLVVDEVGGVLELRV